MNMSQYPAAIAQAAQTVNDLDSQIQAVQLNIHRLEASIDKQIAFDSELKNDSQRKARRFELLEVNLEYQHALNTVMRLTNQKANAVANLEYLRNQFSVAKLEARLAIARQLNGSDIGDLLLGV
ncbi:hypothetical protein [Coleofasciculus chthonoplastes]|jgi:uncharacterized small protein (DUF1192 family)|uniref:Uncharacterized protein n=1 Tax=Coleofasciculus chthonoplastes PCC 7420 TaxID=118168 RepID=B4VSC2_9CYAN|nr:hypothetical protein [Coleofasciculus chthonoplastes]EDX75134.1 hypothetical protein MC7420_2138 [Coleofasciculus chthonoplastes PCC 7420]